eukprot:504034_1
MEDNKQLSSLSGYVSNKGPWAVKSNGTPRYDKPFIIAIAIHLFIKYILFQPRIRRCLFTRGHHSLIAQFSAHLCIIRRIVAVFTAPTKLDQKVSWAMGLWQRFATKQIYDQFRG